MTTMKGMAMKLTILRVILIPLFIIAFYWHPAAWGQWLALIIYTVACISDYLDGWIARKYGEESPFGAFLDPVADKLMVCTVLAVVLQSRPEIWLMLCTIIIVGREIWISALREWMAGLGKRSVVAVSNAGKWKTTAQMFSLGFLIYQERFIGLPIWQIGQVLLIAAAAGSAVRAVADGQVVFAEWMSGYGLLCIIDHGNGYMSLYAHNDALMKEAGSRVRRGDTIASVGNSGGQGRPALYFELRRAGRPVNPNVWLRR